jgi:molybdopterin/thiamine biosynthesis adenylyltransferase/nitroreductase
VSPSINEPDCFRPVVFPDDEPLDSDVLARLRADPSTVVVDQTATLTRHLSSLRPPVDPADAEEGLRWVYFPWRRTLVALPGPLLFRRIRFDRNRYQITSAEQDRFRSARIGIAGLSVGHSIAHTLAMEGLCGLLRLADFDELELWNLNRLPASVLDLGENKAVIAARRIAEIDPYLPVEVDVRGVVENSIGDFIDGLDIVIDECDSLDIKVLLRIAARERGIPVIMATSDRGLIDVERFDLDRDLEIFHGMLGPIEPSTLRGLSVREKAPYVMRILEPMELSARLAASLVETDRTLLSWPQLAGDVVLGAAGVATAVRRILRGEPVPSGRARLDLDEQLAGLRRPPTTADEPAGDDGPAIDPRPSTRPASALDAMALACTLAPSGGNSQPWTVTRRADRIDITVAAGHRTAMDVGFRGSYVAVGAAAFNARVAAAAYAAVGPVDIDIDPKTGHPGVAVRLGSGIDENLAGDYRSMIDRMSNRTRGVRRDFTTAQLHDLAGAVADEGARLIMITDAEPLGALADLLADSDRLRYLTPTLHREMLGELKWPGRDRLDRGIDVRTLSLDPIDLVKLDVAGRADVMRHLAQWNLGSALGDTTRERVRHASGLAVITVRGQRPTDYVIGGMALERFWVSATRLGLGVYPISPVFMYARNDNDLASLTPDHPRELGAMRERFSTILQIGAGEAIVLVLRVAHNPDRAVRSGRLSRRVDDQVDLE